MPRRPRDVSPGPHHVWVNATDDWPLFANKEDRLTWLRLFVRLLEERGWICVAFCQLDTHVHAIVIVPDSSLATGMRDLNREYALTFNAVHGRVGAFQRKRFGSRRVVDGRDLVGVYAYVVCNPVEAGACDRPEEWSWSSYATSIGLRHDFPFVDASAAIAEAGGVGGLRAAVNARVEQLHRRRLAVR